MSDPMMRHFGRRGLCLVLLGLIWVLLGLGLLVGDPPDGGYMPAQFVPLPWLGVGWVVTGVVAAAFAPVSRDDTEGFAAVSLMPIGWAAGWVWSWAAALTPGGYPGAADGWRAAVVWTAVIAVIWLIASWPEPRASGNPA